MELIALMVMWGSLSIIAGMAANNKGRSAAIFFLLSVLLSPLVGIMAALIAQPDVESMDNMRLSRGGLKRCPYCAELIRKAAIVCPCCCREISPALIGQVTREVA